MRLGVRRGRCFILLEVLVAMVIAAIAFVAILRAVTMSLEANRVVRITEQAIYLADALMQDFILEPPEEGRIQGEFRTDPRFGDAFTKWSYEVEVEEKDIRYDEKPRGKLRQDLEPIMEMTIRVIQEDTLGERKTRLTLVTYALEPTLYSNQALQTNQLF